VGGIGNGGNGAIPGWIYWIEKSYDRGSRWGVFLKKKVRSKGCSWGDVEPDGGEFRLVVSGVGCGSVACGGRLAGCEAWEGWRFCTGGGFCTFLVKIEGFEKKQAFVRENVANFRAKSRNFLGQNEEFTR